jgi:uncharacterized protein YkwD
VRRAALPGAVLLIALLGAAVLAVRARPAGADATCAVPRLAMDEEEAAALAAINAARAGAGLAPLTPSVGLMRAARWKSEHMAAGAPFAHDDTDRTWFERVRDCGYEGAGYLGENLAAGTERGADAVRLWNGSPPHRANLLDPRARAIGIARARGGPWGWYWTANFGDVVEDAAAPTGGAQ